VGGPFGGTFRWSNPLDIDSFNFMAATSAYSANVNNNLWDSMIALDWEGVDMPWLAESYNVYTHADDASVPAGHTRLVFNLIQNATWTDGQPLTAEDVAFTLNFYRDAPSNQYGVDLKDMSAAYAKTAYQVVVEFTSESYWYPHTVGYKPILPKHVFAAIGAEHWSTWNPIPPTTKMVLSGPFNCTDWVPGEFCELSYNPNYFFGLQHGPGTTTTTVGGTDLTMAIVAGAVGAAVVILVGGYVLLRQK
jgi:peptide/nickel transport system substrate-binding protein